jgi:hypothetical protein
MKMSLFIQYSSAVTWHSSKNVTIWEANSGNILSLMCFIYSAHITRIKVTKVCFYVTFHLAHLMSVVDLECCTMAYLMPQICNAKRLQFGCFKIVGIDFYWRDLPNQVLSYSSFSGVQIETTCFNVLDKTDSISKNFILKSGLSHTNAWAHWLVSLST